MKTCIVIGGGPAGYMAAYALSKACDKVLLFERTAKPLQKVLASGGGRCNISNLLEPVAQAKAFGSKQSSFVLPSFKAFGSNGIQKFFLAQNLALYSPDSIHLYPKSDRAIDIVQAINQQAKKTNVEIVLNANVDTILIEQGEIKGVKAEGTLYKANAVVLATGGKGYPRLCGHPSGYKLACLTGHSIHECAPGLVGLKAREEWVKFLAGTSIENAHVSVIHTKTSMYQGTFCGSVLFTHEGISGPAILNVSACAAHKIAQEGSAEIQIRPVADMDEDSWKSYLLDIRRMHGKKKLVSCLATRIPKKLAGMLLEHVNVSKGIVCGETPAQAQRQLIRLLGSGIILSITKTFGWDSAMVTGGGISRKEINPRTLQSKIVKNLYFAGEIIDVNGPCGGYNLTWACSSGYVAGNHAAQVVSSY